MLIRFKGAHIVDPGNINEQKDLLVKDGLVHALLDPGAADPEPGIDTVDVTGMLLVPGLIDLHVHLREPGHEYKETIQTGLMAAAKGGFTAVCPMPNTSPVNDNAQVTRFILDRAKAAGLSRVYPVGAITLGLKGETLAEYGEMKQAGMVAITDDGRPVENARVMRRAMEYATGLGLPVMSHSEDLSLARDGAMNEGSFATRIGIKGIPNAAESIMVMREIAIAELTHARVHIAHVSCEESVDAIRHGKQRGVQVTCETAPHYFTLTDKAVGDYDTHAKMNPPLRSEADRLAVIKGLQDGTIDCIATDHAPHSPLEKAVEFDQAAFGIIGLETSLVLSLKLVQDELLSMETLVEKMSRNPARFLGLDNRLIPGNPADITVIDPDRVHVIDPETFVSKSRNTPFAGIEVKGEVLLTMVEGRIIYQREI
ncbi:PyrC [Desulforapulum autotrophicum HRM2]|uniref:Dihydroorotase n=1 Tax=Desulforapulum autotrophicum (strain ATCC 43914 / DSM 3382 / VKM B-1955 / HRM2) TaxID=177437 RepID=PYRC_DESAH|nr:dihydroorotase [Desulforapulum autotrophicum]C0QJ54.1 RecName: Full=Dihydroorotase; Short=DHOase [Desulforapulum autotrophicum HRM2]ACN15867.1 PyrC [Desulforapulum autotrophicum HRM2]